MIDERDAEYNDNKEDMAMRSLVKKYTDYTCGKYGHKGVYSPELKTTGNKKWRFNSLFLLWRNWHLAKGHPAKKKGGEQKLRGWK